MTDSCQNKLWGGLQIVKWREVTYPGYVCMPRQQKTMKTVIFYEYLTKKPETTHSYSEEA